MAKDWPQTIVTRFEDWDTIRVHGDRKIVEVAQNTTIFGQFFVKFPIKNILNGVLRLIPCRAIG